MTVIESDVASRPALRRRSARVGHLSGASGLGLGVSVLWFSLLVLIPLSAVLVKTSAGGWGGFWDVLSDGQTQSALRLTITQSFYVTVLNVFMGTLIAWVLVRDHFFGKRALEVVIDIPFALPTIVAGLVLLSLYGPKSPIGVNVATRSAGADCRWLQEHDLLLFPVVVGEQLPRVRLVLLGRQ